MALFKRFVFTVTVLCSVCAEGRSQQMEFTRPVPLEIINSETEDIAPLVSPDGNELYFVRAFHEDNAGGELAGMDIWRSQKDSLGNWQAPTNDLGPWNNRENNAVIGIRKDNKVIYLLNSYFRGKGISFSKYLNGKWIKPELLEFKWAQRKEFIGFYMHPDFDVLLLSEKGKNSQGEEDIYVSLKDSLGTWGEPINLGTTINTAGFEISPFLSHDKKRLYFASNGHGGYGDADIFVSERLYDNWTVWSKPVNLGNKINSEKFDAYFSIGEDSTVYFSSNRDSTFADIYRSEMEILASDKRVTKLLEEAEDLLKEVEGLKSVDKPTDYIIVEFKKFKKELSSNDLSELKDFVNSYSAKYDYVKYRLVAFSNSFGDAVMDNDLSGRRLEGIKQLMHEAGVDKRFIETTIQNDPNSLAISNKEYVKLQIFVK